jgi:hypothetical protein
MERLGVQVQVLQAMRQEQVQEHRAIPVAKGLDRALVERVAVVVVQPRQVPAEQLELSVVKAEMDIQPL